MNKNVSKQYKTKKKCDSKKYKSKNVGLKKCESKKYEYKNVAVKYVT